MAEEMGELAGDILPLAAPLTEYLHTRYLRFFLEQDVVGHMESELGAQAAAARPGPGHPLLHRPHRLHPLHRGGGRPGGARRGRELRRNGRGDAAARGDDREDDRRRGDGRLARPGLADRVGGRPARPLPRAPAAAGRHPLRARPSTATATTSAPTSTSPTGSSAAPRPARCWSPTASSRRSRVASGSTLEPIGEVTLKGFPEPTAALRRPAAPTGMTRALAVRRRAMLEPVREGGLLAPGAPLVAMLSGGRDSVCLLDLAVRLLGPGGGHRAPRQLRAARRLRRGRGALRGALRAARGARSRSSARAGPRARATSRPGRATPATRRRPGWRWPDEALIATGHTADDQVETILYRLASSPSRRALLGMRPRDGSLVRPLLGFTREQTTAYCEERGLAWRDDPTNEEPAYARNRVRHGLAAGAGRGPPGRRPQRPAHGRAAARRGRGARRARRRRARRLQRRRAPRHDRARAGSASCRRPCAGSSSSASPTAPPAARCRAPPATPRRSRPCAAPAPRCSTSAAASARSSSAASSTPSAEPPTPSYLDCGA